MRTIKINTEKREEVVDITEKVKENINIKDGVAVVYLKHTSAAIVINENDDPKVCDDFLSFLSKLVPRNNWGHDKSGRCDRSNGDSHIKASIIGPSKVVPIKDGNLGLGKWQNVWLCEFDGPREREVIVQCLANTAE